MFYSYIMALNCLNPSIHIDVFNLTDLHTELYTKPTSQTYIQNYIQSQPHTQKYIQSQPHRRKPSWEASEDVTYQLSEQAD